MSNAQQDARNAQMQQQALGAGALLGGLGGQAATRPPTNIEQATARILVLIEKQEAQIALLGETIDRVNGAEPQTERDCESEGCGSGQLSELHFQIERLENLTRTVGNKIEQIAGTI